MPRNNLLKSKADDVIAMEYAIRVEEAQRKNPAPRAKLYGLIDLYEELQRRCGGDINKINELVATACDTLALMGED